MRFTPLRHRPDHRGSVLMMALIAGSVAAALTLGVILVVRNLVSQAGRGKFYQARDGVMDRVGAAARQPMNVNASASIVTNPPQPQQLSACALRDSVNCTPDGTWREFTLVDSKFNPIAGTTAAPVRYDLEMQVCGAPSQRCPFEARAEFRASCNPGPTCDVADLIDVRTDVRVAPGVQLRVSGSQMGMREVQTVDKAAPVPEVRRLAGREVAARGRKTCEPGFEFRGTDEFGRPVCVQNAENMCGVPNSFVTGVDFANKNFSCSQIGAPQSCPDGTYFAGWQASGAPVCHSLLPIIDQKLLVYINQYKGRFNRCPSDTISVGLNPDGSSLCEPLHFSIGTIGMNGPAAVNPPVQNHLVAVPWTPMGARCAMNFDSFVGGSHLGQCTCAVVLAQPGSVLFQTFYATSGFVNVNQNACGFTYFNWGTPNESGP